MQAGETGRLSIALMTEAWKADIPAGRKFVLLSLCDNANDQGECFPSISMVAKRCNMGERTVQNHIHDLESLGILSRNERAGRSTIYTINPRRFTIGIQQAHYVYRITDADTAEFYIGVRTCQGDPAQDGYMGSGAWFNKRLSDGGALRKNVLQTFETREAACQAERQLISEWIQDPLCMNQRTPADSAPRSICTPQISHPTPAIPAPQPPQISHPTPADFAPITIKEPSEEPKKRKSAPLCVAVDLLVAEGFDAKTAGDFIAHKTDMKAPLTERAWADHLREAMKAGWSPLAAAEKVMARSWKGFEAKYVANEKPNKSTETNYARSMREKYEQAAPMVAAKKPGATRLNPMEVLDGYARIAD